MDYLLALSQNYRKAELPVAETGGGAPMMLDESPMEGFPYYGVGAGAGGQSPGEEEIPLYVPAPVEPTDINMTQQRKIEATAQVAMQPEQSATSTYPPPEQEIIRTAKSNERTPYLIDDKFTGIQILLIVIASLCGGFAYFAHKLSKK